jgi:hypothetical protein
MYLDISVESRGVRTAIELKYKTRRLETEVNGELYSLANHGAADCGKYDVLKDIERLEQVVVGTRFDEGWMIFLTNDPHYFSNHSDHETIDQAFRLSWKGRIRKLAMVGTSGKRHRSREKSILLKGTYHLQWQDYSKLDVAQNGHFKILVLEINYK